MGILRRSERKRERRRGASDAVRAAREFRLRARRGGSFDAVTAVVGAVVALRTYRSERRRERDDDQPNRMTLRQFLEL
jgi:hypothetical protein